MLYCSDAKDFYVKKILRINTMALLITLAYNKSFSTASSVWNDIGYDSKLLPFHPSKWKAE